MKDTLDKDRFDTLISCVGFYLVNRNDALDAILTNIRDASRKVLQKKEKVRRAPTFVDFFCGAGGLSCGFRQAGFKVVLANDIQDVCCETYRYNHPELPDDTVVQGDIKAIINNLEEYIKQPVDMVVGGPLAKDSAQPTSSVLSTTRGMSFTNTSSRLSRRFALNWL